MTPQFDVIVIGAGPAGYVGAIRAAQLGMTVACVEKEKLGGTCLNVGCIPSKALLESSELYLQAKEKLQDHGIGIGKLSLDLKQFMARKDAVVKQLTGGVAGLFKKNKVTSFLGNARLAANKTVIVETGKDVVTLSANHIIIATGSAPVALPALLCDGTRIIDSTAALSLAQIPNDLLVVGGGYIGLELGSVYRRLGSAVTVVEALDRIVPGMDRDVGAALHKALIKQGIAIKVSCKVTKASVKGKKVELVLESSEGKTTHTADVVLVAVGRRAYTEGLGLKELGIATDDRGRIVVDERYQTAVSGIYAVGDVIAGPMLAHKASEEGVALVETLAGQRGHVNYRAIPSVIYTWPEVACVGMTEAEAKDAGIDISVAKFPFLANGRALSMGEKDGFVKLIADKSSDRLIGAHIIGPRASDMIAELVLGMEFSASAEDIARTIHAHPTLAEAVKESALGLGSGTIHL